MGKVLLLSGHFLGSRRKAGFHFIAEALKEIGHEVVFVTTTASLLMLLRFDYRFKSPFFLINCIFPLNLCGIRSIVNFTITHPLKSKYRIIEKISLMLYRINIRVMKEARNADIVIWESVPSVIFLSRVKLANPKAMMIYRMSDDMESIGYPNYLVKMENNILKEFDRVSVPSMHMHGKFFHLCNHNLQFLRHGLNMLEFDECKINPYEDNINFVFIGNSYLDLDFLRIASEFDLSYKFHVIGPFEDTLSLPNVIFYGEMPFSDTVKYIKFASVGLQIRTNDNGIAGTLTDSLKVLQYEYCNLKIIAPDVMQNTNNYRWLFYKYKDKKSIFNAIKQVEFSTKNNAFDCANILSWKEMTLKLINE